ncbi:unnamed protein product [Rotaria sordida]|uniref:G-protein coupled receptors family 1 profile domain-containing protein n=1 Tax=Rotaria sordida TaxID=392033 RepID=A0A815PJ68_9BILA|nr:unnamed protein product [Rotaria sordida]CAF1508071.1 unnamed protein product [Rotaria sordida]CAF4082642.1 unnamed protein product [Rotaria sordida]CAF4130660.1 unnamed protein product [Rotaria sordida]
MDAYIYRLIRFILLISFLIPSFICFLLVFFYLVKNREINSKQLQHHVILVLLVCNFILITTELPISLLYSYQGYVKPESNQFCSFWVAYNYGLYVAGLFLMAFGSIERYFLIFHERYVIKWRFIIHYPIILICFIYPLTFYNVIVNTYPCENVYYYDAYVCGGACYQYEAIVGTIDYLINVVTPTMFIILANIILLLRFTYKKRAMKLANTWRKYRLMYIQLVSISMLYFIIWIPFVIISLIRLFYDYLFLQDVTMLIINYCLYICPLASPFISLVGLPGARQHLRRNNLIIPWISRNAQNLIGPTATFKTRTEQQQMAPRKEHDEHTF